MKKQILSIGGGGGNGLIPAIVLAELERRAGKPVWQLFEQIFGTSIGGIMAQLYAAGVPATEVLKFFTEDGPNIFKPRVLGTDDILEPKFGAAVIEDVLQRRFGNTALADAKTKVGVTSFDLVTKRPFFFKSYDKSTQHFMMWQAARATSAAPTYFPAFQLGEQVFWDGGVVANQPVCCAYADFVKLYGDDEPVKVLALSCGNAPFGIDAKGLINAGIIHNASVAFDVLFNGGAEIADYLMTQFVGNDYFSVNPPMTRAISMADFSPAAIAEREQVGAQAVSGFSAVIDEFSDLAP